MYKIFPKIPLIIVSLLFFLGIILGFNFTDIHRGDKYVDPDGLLFLINNNLKANAFIASGFITLGFGTVIYLIFNGAILGSSINLALSYEGSNYFHIFLAILPHGIFEIPAMLLAGIIGFQIIEFFIYFFFNNSRVLLRKFLILLLLRIITVVLLTILAGLIEWYITLEFFKGDYLK